MTAWLVHSFAEGAILAWYGTIAKIPNGWVICDGTNGTPDLRDRFLVGAGSSYSPGDSGNEQPHVHDFTSNTHRHSLPAGATVKGASFDLSNLTTLESETGTVDNENIKPPFHGLVYIMEKRL